MTTDTTDARAVCFDMDGVVVDSERHWVPLEEEHLFPDAGVPEASAAEITGMNYREVYGYLADRYQPTVDRETFLASYEAAAEELYAERADLMDGFPDLVADLRAADRMVALVSSSPRDWIEVVLDRFDLHDGFDLVLSAEAVEGTGKPAPDVYLAAAGRLGVGPEECVAVEDSRHGTESAAAAGMAVVGYAPADGVVLDVADVVVEGPAGLRTALLGGR